MENPERAKRPRLNEAGEWRYETVHRMDRRCQGWDYTARCIYEITIELENRASRSLGQLLVRAASPSSPSGASPWQPVAALCGETAAALQPDDIEARVERSPLGEAIYAHFWRIADFTPELKPLYCEIMPDHFHFIVEVTRQMARPLGNAIGGFKTGCEKIYRQLGHEGRLLKAGFVDKILFHQGQLANWFAYLKDNPRRLAVKLLWPELFSQVAELRVDLWLAPQEQDGGAPADGSSFRPQAPADGPSFRPRAPVSGFFSALGNRFLLHRPLAQVQVSRRFFAYKREVKPGGGLKIARDAAGEPLVDFESAEYRARRDELLTAAKRGAVLLSPCVSDGERQIAREALKAKLPLVTMANKGFSKRQKPVGRSFDACAAGNLLMLAPAAWPYQPGEKPMTRFDATAMNRLCQWIAGLGAAEINYHGMRPANIDALARAAARASAD